MKLVFQFLKKYKLLLAIILFGFILRLFQLGDDILWYDEVGVYSVTKVKTFAEIVFIVRSHVMAMPLDYLITWMISHLGTSNAILRFPSVVWGTLTLPICYVFFKQLSDTKSALFGTLLLAISPFHIQYSQELRFYASLTFFYILSTYDLLEAIKNPCMKRWLVFTITTIIGVYFHVYVLLVLVNGLIWFLFGERALIDRQKLFRPLALTSTLILLAFAVGFFTFSGRVTFANPFLETGITFMQALFTGLGWLPFYSNSLELSWGWGLACVILQIWGLKLILKFPRSPVSLLAFSISIQMAANIGLDIFKTYFFMPRQLLSFLPILILIAGIGLSDLHGKWQNWISQTKNWKDMAKVRKVGSVIMVVLILLINFPALETYYKGTKGNADQITGIIKNTWRTGSTVLVINPYEAGYYNYFFADVIKDETIIPSVWQADWKTVGDSKGWPGKTFDISPFIVTPDQQEILTMAGYRLIPLNYEFSRYNRLLWVKND
jgi:uncharacterized membrane protein